mgnify:CR=1 FL=1
MPEPHLSTLRHWATQLEKEGMRLYAALAPDALRGPLSARRETSGERGAVCAEKRRSCVMGRERPAGIRKVRVLAGVLLLASLSRAVAAEGLWTTQVASMSSEREADAKVDQLKARGVDAYWVRSTVPRAGIRYRVRVGQFASKTEAQSNGERLRSQGVAQQFFVAEYEAPADPAIADRGRPTEAATNSAPGDSDFLTFEDAAVGYSFQHPSHWTGAAWSDAERLSRVGGGASFRSREDRTFLNAVWNKLPDANDPQKYDNTKLADTVVKNLRAGADMIELSAESPRVENDGSQIKMYVDLKARFLDPATNSTTEQFFGKAVISRCQQGILLVVVFYSQNAPPIAATNADRIVHSVRAPA